MQGERAGHVARLERLDHLLGGTAEQVRRHADHADRADREQRQRVLVVAGVVREVGLPGDLGGRREVALGVLDRHDPLVLGEAQHGGGLDGGAGADRDVVHHHRQPAGVGDGAEVAQQPFLRRLVVVGGHREDGVRAGLLGGVRQLDAVVGVVGADACDDRRPAADRLDDGTQQRLLLRVGRGR